jgi:transcriptional antiterminator NusG
MAARWYVVHVYSGFENKVAEEIRERAVRNGLEAYIEDIMVPTETVTEVKRGKKEEAERKFFPGYILISLDLTDEVWHMVKEIPKVTGFLGANNKPSPITRKEAERMMSLLQEGAAAPRQSLAFDIGEEIKVIEGPFASFTGVVEDVDSEKSRLKVSVSIFGRATPVELEYHQVEKT